jgi:hypothetical protein
MKALPITNYPQQPLLHCRSTPLIDISHTTYGARHAAATHADTRLHHQHTGYRITKLSSRLHRKDTTLLDVAVRYTSHTRVTFATHLGGRKQGLHEYRTASDDEHDRCTRLLNLLVREKML